MYNIISNGLIDQMIHEACNIAAENGLRTRNAGLLSLSGSNKGLIVRNGRIFPSPDAIRACLEHVKGNHVSPGDQKSNHHGWEDMIVNHSGDNILNIRLTDLPYLYCEHRDRKIIPLTRQHVIEGTKLLHVLSQTRGIKGYSCGVPQDTAPELKAIEQYLIAYRFNENGGGTIQSVSPAVEKEFAQIRSLAEDRDCVSERSLMLFSPSPLVLDADDLYLFFRPGIKVTSYMTGSMPMMGMTGPTDPMGVYILGLAEVIGGAAILHALFPEARAYLYPHPQAMDIRTGHMAFGTVEHARLEIIKMQVMKGLGLPYYDVKDIMTSAQMPGSMAQGDKALGFFTGLIAGFRSFNLMPLSTDQVWSPVQALLDIQALTDAWETLQPINEKEAIGRASETIREVTGQNSLFGESMDTLMKMSSHYQQEVLHKRYQTAESWQDAGSPDELDAVEQKAAELLSSWNYHPREDRFGKVMDIYIKLCRKYNTDPIQI